MTIALIDGDILVYRCGFAAERSKYKLSNIASGIEKEFDYKKEVDAFVKENGIDLDGWVLEKNKIIEPLGYALNNVRTVIEAILERLQCTDYRLFLSGGENFRDAIAVTRPYKGNRDRDHRPVYYKEIRDYLVDTWQAEVTNGVEADDVIHDIMKEQGAIREDIGFVIVSTDKDLDQIPGPHYNWVKGEEYFVDPYEAAKIFWQRVLSGDPTDNIQGIPKMGEVKAQKYLDAFDPHEWEEAVKARYMEVFGNTEGLMSFNENRALVQLGTPSYIKQLRSAIADITSND